MLSSRVGTVSCPGVDGHILPCAERCHMSGVRVSNVLTCHVSCHGRWCQSRQCQPGNACIG